MQLITIKVKSLVKWLQSFRAHLWHWHSSAFFGISSFKMSFSENNKKSVLKHNKKHHYCTTYFIQNKDIVRFKLFYLYTWWNFLLFLRRKESKLKTEQQPLKSFICTVYMLSFFENRNETVFLRTPYFLLNGQPQSPNSMSSEYLSGRNIDGKNSTETSKFSPQPHVLRAHRNNSSNIIVLSVQTELMNTVLNNQLTNEAFNYWPALV